MLHENYQLVLKLGESKKSKAEDDVAGIEMLMDEAPSAADKKTREEGKEEVEDEAEEEMEQEEEGTTQRAEKGRVGEREEEAMNDEEDGEKGVFKKKVISILEKADLLKKRPAKMEILDFLSLLEAFNKEGIHFT